MSTTVAAQPGAVSSILPVGPFEVAEAPLAPGADRAAVPTGGWLPAVVPGGVHESLLAAGRIPDPNYDLNEAEVRWIEDRDWWFRTTLSRPTDLAEGERLRLVFHGLDTVVDIWLDGEMLGHHENMFRPAEFDVTERLTGSSTLELRFSPPLAGLEVPSSVIEMGTRLGDAFAALAGEGEAEGGLAEMLPLAVLRRKATFSWGWDFGPRVPSIGIWRPVELVRERVATMTGHHVRATTVDAAAGTATVAVDVDVEAFGPGDLEVAVVLRSPAGTTVEALVPVVDGRAAASFELSDAQLWWTHDLGGQPLYDVRLTLSAGDTVLGTIDDRVGLRTIALDRSDDPEGGRIFRFVLNGVPIFARGGAWLPASMLVGSVDPDRIARLVSTARQGNMNMLRIWGGGIYEQDAFYTACDEAGVLVWQDFMFACIDYPSALESLQREVRLEAEYQVRRLRNRASLALWSGNNEVHLIHGFAYQNYEEGNWGWHFFHSILPETVAALDGAVPYWPGSPYGEAAEEGFMAVNGVLDGDRHAWEVWHGFDFGAGGGDYASAGEARHYRRYANDKGKFISEFGIHASPERSTLEKWIPADQLTVHSESFDHHNKDNPKDKGDAMMEIITGVPASLDEYVDFTMVTQGEGLKFGIEHYRRRAPHNNGTLVWQFNDVWPGFSWSVVDFEGIPKAGYYLAAGAFEPVLASFTPTADGGLELWLSNSTAEPVTRTMRVEIAGFQGGTVFETSVTGTVAAGESARVWAGTAEEVAASSARFAWVSGEGVRSNRWFFGEIKDVEFGPSELEIEREDVGAGSARITVTSRGYSYLVRVLSPAGFVRFSDNYFDLRDGESTTIEVTQLPEGVTAADLVVTGYIGQRS
jgi:beta-mannosidase